ncbi:MAG: carbohydrate-binding family 9-like protein [Clostridia bacterium]|nr:carbohydrate-binding family 9-like protein [Clostridia bacterium]
MYIIKKTENDIKCINDKGWDNAEVAVIDTINWEGECGCPPKTTAKLLYNDFGLYVRMETDEKPLLARYTEQNSPVHTDSCMEFFFRPNENDPRYLNFEFNPFGTMYFAIRTSREDFAHIDKDKKFFNVKSYVDDKKWVLQFCVPFSFIDEVFGSHSTTIYGNLYKCGDETENPHYATYYPIKSDEPDYHRPECFDKFILE